MSERDTHTTDWIAGWIEQQRDTLRRQFAAGHGETDDRSRDTQHEAAELGRLWAQRAQALFTGLGAQGVPGGAAATLDPFGIGASLLGAWTSATSIQSSMAEQAAEMLRRLPPVGLAREHTEAWRELAAAHAECTRLEQQLREALVNVQLEALELLEQRARESKIDSFKALYALWVDCGEQVYGRLAHSAEYSQLQARLGNAAMRLRARLQAVIERALAKLDLPTRSELNSLHRQVRDLRRELERLRADDRDADARKPTKSKSTKRNTTQREPKARTP